MTDDKLYTVVVDEGSSQCKVAWMEDGEIKTHVVSSSVQIGSGDLGEELQTGLKIGDIEFHASKEGLPNNNADFQTSLQNVFAVHNALIESGFAGKRVHVSVTVPISMYFGYSSRGGQTKDEKLIAKKKNNLLTMKPTPLFEGITVADIVGVAVHCESKPAFLSTMFDENFDPVYDYFEDDTFLVIDIGDTTTDIAHFEADGKMLNGGFLSIPKGVSDLRKDVDGELSTKFGRLSSTMVANAMRTNVARIRGVSHDISEILDTCKRERFHELRTEILNKLSVFNSVAKIIVVGGGAAVYGEYFKSAWPDRTIVPDNYVTALAEGILRLETLQSEAR